jgi:valyl-tRNA synthetase
MTAQWPFYDEKKNDPESEKAMQRVMSLVREVRNVRTGMNVPPSKKASLIVVSEDSEVRDIYSDLSPIYANLAGASEVRVQNNKDGVTDDAVSAVVPDATVYIPLEELVDLQKERERLEKEEKRLQGELKRSNGMLSNPRFLEKAPAEKVQEEKDKLKDYEKMLEDVQKRLSEMK